MVEKSTVMDLKSELEMLANYREDNIPSPAIQFMHFHARRALEALEALTIIQMTDSAALTSFPAAQWREINKVEDASPR